MKTYLGQHRYVEAPEVVVNLSEVARPSDLSVVHPAGQMKAGVGEVGECALRGGGAERRGRNRAGIT